MQAKDSPLFQTYQMIEIAAKSVAADLWSRIDRNTVVEHYGKKMGSSHLVLSVMLARAEVEKANGAER